MGYLTTGGSLNRVCLPDALDIRSGEEELPEEEDGALRGPLSAAGVQPPGGGTGAPGPVGDQVRPGEHTHTHTPPWLSWQVTSCPDTTCQLVNGEMQ